MKKLTPYFSAVWIDGQLARTACQSGEEDAWKPSNTSKCGCDYFLPFHWQLSDVHADDVVKRFNEQMLCQVGLTQATEQAQHELRQRIEHPKKIRGGVVDSHRVWVAEA